MKNRIIDFITMIVTLLLVTLLFVTVALPQYQITNSVIGSGGNIISNSNNNIVSTVGEAFIGKSSNTVNQNQIGFWYAYQQSTITDVENEETIPTVFKLEQNYPNPFNPSTTIRYRIPEPGKVTLKVYDILGREVITLLSEEQATGTYEAKLNASMLSSGVYFYQLRAGDYVQTKKMVLLR